MKPVASGACIENGFWQHDDVKALQMASNVNADIDDSCPYFLKDPIAPSIAAERQGVSILLDTIEQAYDRLSFQADLIIVETAGGALVPLNNQFHLNMLSIGKRLQLPVILVVGIRLGAINHALLTCQAILASKLSLLGWVANRIETDTEDDQDEVIALLKDQIKAPLLADIPFMPEKQTGNAVTEQKNVHWALPDMALLLQSH